jgi:CBS domain-containing protein
MAFIPDQIQKISHLINEGGTPEPVTVRALLGWYGCQRRGRFVVEWIRRSLAEARLVTDPDFDSVWIDALITFRAAEETSSRPEDRPSEEGPATAAQPEAPQAIFVGGAVPDPTNKVGKLEAARKGVVSIAPEDSIERAVTLMMANGFSQLPVMVGEREVKGMVTWESITRKVVLGGSCARVLDCVEEHREISADRSLFAAIPEIVQSQYVLVRDSKDKRITGIITASDLSLQFQQLAEPFLLLGEIEHQIRRLIENRFTQSELAEVKDPADSERSICSVADLTLGECVRLLDNDERWQKLGLKIDRREFNKEARRICEIRNDVMHFDPDPLGPDDLSRLRRFVSFVAELAKFMPPPARAASVS